LKQAIDPDPALPAMIEWIKTEWKKQFVNSESSTSTADNQQTSSTKQTVNSSNTSNKVVKNTTDPPIKNSRSNLVDKRRMHDNNMHSHLNELMGKTCNHIHRLLDRLIDF